MHNSMRAAFPCAITVVLSVVSPCRAEDIGRYQLFQGTYPFINLKGEGFRENALFRIDTVTGKTWVARSNQYCLKPNDCKQSTGWAEFEMEVKIAPSGQ